MITEDQAALLLAFAASYDTRTIGEADALAWHRALHRLNYDRCLEAIAAHYVETKDRIMPSDIVGRLRGDDREAAKRTNQQGLFAELDWQRRRSDLPTRERIREIRASGGAEPPRPSRLEPQLPGRCPRCHGGGWLLDHDLQPVARCHCRQAATA